MPSPESPAKRMTTRSFSSTVLFSTRVDSPYSSPVSECREVGGALYPAFRDCRLSDRRMGLTFRHPVTQQSGRALTGLEGMATFSAILLVATAIGLIAFLFLLER